MGIMELDPPDYWLLDDPDGPATLRPPRRLWLVAPLTHEKGHQVLLVRVNPPHRVGFMDHDFVVLEPLRYDNSLWPTRVGATRVNLYLYHGQYRGQAEVGVGELSLHTRGAAISRDDWAMEAQAYLLAHGGLPDWAKSDSRPDAPPERPSARWTPRP